MYYKLEIVNKISVKNMPSFSIFALLTIYIPFIDLVVLVINSCETR